MEVTINKGIKSYFLELCDKQAKEPEGLVIHTVSCNDTPFCYINIMKDNNY